jgi:polyisoprenoid-binding protein YceI
MTTIQTTGGLDQLTAGAWDVDASHSSVDFVARHAMISKVRGTFSTFSGEITIAEDVLQSSLRAAVDIRSLSTGDAQRDGHLLSGDFFDVEAHPELSFASTGLREHGDGWHLDGDLTVNGITRPVTFELEFNGVTQDPFGNTRAGFSASATVNRKDFGLQWNVVLEAGGVLVSDKIRIELEVEAVRRPEQS